MKQDANDRNRRILDAVHEAELGTGKTPYAAYFAQKGKSGMSFGYSQHDVASNPKAAKGLSDTLVDAQHPDGTPAFSPEEQKKALALASRPGITAEAFEKEAPGLLGKVNQALDSEVGREMVDGRDAERDKTLDEYRTKIEEAAKRNPAGPGVFDPSHPDYPQAMAMAVQWGNRTGGVDNLAKWASGEAVDLATKTGRPEKAVPNGAPSLDGMQNGYFAKTEYFRDTAPKELPTWTQNHKEIAGRLAPVRPEDVALPKGQGGWSPERGKLPEQSAPEPQQPRDVASATQSAVGESQNRQDLFSRPQSSIKNNLIQDHSTIQNNTTLSGLPERPTSTLVEPQATRKKPLPRPVNMLLDPLHPDDDPEGFDRAEWERRNGTFGELSSPISASRGSGLYVPPPKSQRPPGYVAIYPELDEAEDFAQPARRTWPGGSGNSGSGGSPRTNDSEEMSTLDFVKESFRLAAQGGPVPPRPQRPAWFKPSNPEELTTAEYIWEMFHPEAAKKYRG